MTRGLILLAVVLAAGLVPSAVASRDTPLGVGDRAPDFVLLDQQGKPFKLSEVVAARDVVVLAFYIKADSPG